MADQSVRLLVITDDLGMAWRLTPTLSGEGYEVEVRQSKRGALAALRDHRPHLTVVDEVEIRAATLRRIASQARPYGPVLWLASDKHSGWYQVPSPIIRPLVKPFSLYELVLQVREGLRRGRPVDGLPPAVLQIAELEIDEQTRRVSRRGARIVLSPMEFRLLHLLAERAPQVLSRKEIIDLVWSYDFSGRKQVVDARLRSLRRKIGPPESYLLETVRSTGYRMRLAPR
ncbi:MAG: winged helix-turn-helix transcriptional regulator [Acidimicrobiales bacterium]